MKPTSRSTATVPAALSLTICLLLSSCGLPTAAMRTAVNAVKEVGSLSDGSSSAYQSVQ